MYKCEICGKELTTEKGLKGHIRMKHGDSGGTNQLEPEKGQDSYPEASTVDKPPEAMTLTELKEHVERTELLNRLKAIGGVEERVRPPVDVSESIGLGKMAEPVRAELQSRAFLGNQNQGMTMQDVMGLVQMMQANQNQAVQPQQKSISDWLDEAVSVGQRLGINVQELLQNSFNGKNGAEGELDLSSILGVIGSVSSADGEAVQAIIDYKKHQDIMGIAEKALPQLGTIIQGLIASRSGGNGSNGQTPAETEVAVCPRCNQVYTIPKGTTQACPDCGVALVTQANLDELMTKNDGYDNDNTTRYDEAESNESVKGENSFGEKETEETGLNGRI
ncbi:MAG: C2H2-type zinc finger protein [Dehalococcoidia bacterium]